MTLYQHDAPSAFRFQIIGDLEGCCAAEIEHAWLTATSIVNGKHLAIDISCLSGADAHGTELLIRMRAAGAQFTATSRPRSPGLARLLGVHGGPKPARIEQGSQGFPRKIWEHGTATIQSIPRLRQG